MSGPLPYDAAFYSKLQSGSLSSARQVVPVLISLLEPRSVVDLGCGIGAWLTVFKENGVSDIQGIDGDHVDRKALLIPQDRFTARDLGRQLTLDRRFDLAVSLEVAEHIDASAAGTFIDSLTRLSDTIVFSAAIPLQGGEHHVNEQWPEYWRALFEARGYRLVDCLRPRFWSNQKVERWYRQNLLLYVKDEHLRATPALLAEYEKNKDNVLSLVHPDVYLYPSIPSLLQFIRRTFVYHVRRRLGMLAGTAPRS